MSSYWDMMEDAGHITRDYSRILLNLWFNTNFLLKMTEKEIFEKNLILSTEFDRYVIEHPEFAEKLPQNALVVLLPVDDPELCNINIELAKKQREPGQQIVYIHIGGSAPQMSRLKDVTMEIVAA